MAHTETLFQPGPRNQGNLSPAIGLQARRVRADKRDMAVGEAAQRSGYAPAGSDPWDVRTAGLEQENVH